MTESRVRIIMPDRAAPNGRMAFFFMGTFSVSGAYHIIGTF